MNRMHPLTLSFHDSETERAFVRYMLPRWRDQGRAAIIVGISIYLLYGALDHLFIPVEQLSMVWAIRLSAVLFAVGVLVLTFSPWFEKINQIPLALVGLVASLGLIAILWHLPAGGSAYYFPGLMLAAFYTYDLLGVRFILALAVNLLVLLLYNLLFGGLREYPQAMLLSQNFFMVSANLIGGAAGYLVEYQRRKLFLRELQLDAERRRHLQRSLHDRLTGLPNRELLEDRIAQLVARARRGGATHVGLFVDLDGFKQINDRLGHDRGDTVLREVARRLQAAVRQTDTVSRLGGDEFFVLAHDIDSEDRAAQLAEKLLAAIGEPVADVPQAGRLGASIGICLFSREGRSPESPEQIIRAADQAMYQAKAAGKHRHAFARS